MPLSAEDLLAGGALTHEVELPASFLPDSNPGPVVLRPLTVRDLQRIAKAAPGDEDLAAALMVQLALVEPSLSIDQVHKLPAGLARFLVEKINELSGISTPRDALEELVQAPLARACFQLAKEFGWTPEEVSGMTIGQILLYLEMVRREAK
ncbi:MAG TPA: hypothetical protein VGS22_23930 [Thermoanaerobaculia bacterium]|nr:hypothetical protein [Thermoanaerobaculia bacterium]